MNAGASAIVGRHALDRGVTPKPNIKTNIAVPTLHSQRRTVYFLPDRALIKDGRTYTEAHYQSLHIVNNNQRFIETSTVPSDSTRVGTTWKYVNKSGGPDRRFKDNHQIPVMLYGHVDLATATGLNILWSFSNTAAAQRFANALSQMSSLPTTPSVAHHAPPEPSRPVPQPPADQPTFTPVPGGLVELPSGGHVAVHGESHYQQALAFAVDGRIAGDDLAQHIPVRAVLVPEPDNAWDKRAVRVDLITGDRAVKVGYLPRELAAEYQPNLLTLRKHGKFGYCAGKVAGGGAKYYGVHLDLCYAENLRVITGNAHPMVSQQRDGYAMLRAEWPCTVTKEKEHQPALAKYSPDNASSGREVVAELNLCTAKSGKYQGHPAIEVRLDGLRVGELTHAMTERYRQTVNEILGNGLTPTCKAVVVITKNGLEVELMMPNPTTQDHTIRV